MASNSLESTPPEKMSYETYIKKKPVKKKKTKKRDQKLQPEDLELREIQQALGEYQNRTDRRANLERVVNGKLNNMRQSIEFLIGNIGESLKALEEFTNRFILQKQISGEPGRRILQPFDKQEFNELFREFDYNMNYKPPGSSSIDSFNNEEGVTRKFNKFVKLCEYYFGSIVHGSQEIVQFHEYINNFIVKAKTFIKELVTLLAAYRQYGASRGFSFGLRKVKTIKRIKRIKSKSKKVNFGMKRKFDEEERDTKRVLKTLRSPDYANGKRNIDNLLNITYNRILAEIDDKKEYLKDTIRKINHLKRTKGLYQALIIPVIDAYIDVLNVKIDFVEIVASDPQFLTERQRMMDNLNGFIKRSRKQILSVLTKTQKNYYKEQLRY
jgi:hypothetical protein